MRNVPPATHAMFFGTCPGSSAVVSGLGRRLLPHEHRGGLTLHVDVGLAADVDGDALEGAAGEGPGLSPRIVLGNGRSAVPADAQALAREHELSGLGADLAL